MAKCSILILWILWACLSLAQEAEWTQSTPTYFNPRVCEHHSKDGQFIIGGMVKIYDNIKTPCGGELRADRLGFVESIAYTIDSINKRQDLLPNVDLGYEIRTDCDDEDMTLWTANILTSSVGKFEYDTSCPNSERKSNKKVIAVVGPERSSTSVLAARVGRVFAVPFVSHFASSDELSDIKRFPFFFRTIPPDRYQVKVIIDILQHYNWKYIALFYSLDSYGIHGARQILSLADENGICIAISMPVSAHTTESEIKEIANKLIAHDKVSVIVLFSIAEPARAILHAVKKYIKRKFTFVGSDGLNPKTDISSNSRDVLLGGIFVQFLSDLPQEFKKYFQHLPFNQTHASEWFRRKLREIKAKENCTYRDSCSIPKPHWNTQQVINSVYAIAYALNASLNETNSTAYKVDGWTLRKNLYDVSIPTSEGLLQFDVNGEVSGKYLLQAWQVVENVYQMVQIGIWDSSNGSFPLKIEEHKVQWATQNGKVPISLCVEDCKAGYIKVPLEMKCCWGCQRCNDYAIVTKEENGSKCQDCPRTHWPNFNFTLCEPIAPSYIGYSDIVFVLSACGAGIGLFLTISAAFGLYYNYNHALIKASSREICFINLIGLACSCVVVVLNLLRPAHVTCVATDVGISTCFCISFGPLLLKVNRIWRIFTLELGHKLRFASGRSQIVIASSIIALQVRNNVKVLGYMPSWMGVI